MYGRDTWQSFIFFHVLPLAFFFRWGRSNMTSHLFETFNLKSQRTFYIVILKTFYNYHTPPLPPLPPCPPLTLSSHGLDNNQAKKSLPVMKDINKRDFFIRGRDHSEGDVQNIFARFVYSLSIEALEALLCMFEHLFVLTYLRILDA